jgi:hypothetical protein
MPVPVLVVAVCLSALLPAAAFGAEDTPQSSASQDAGQPTPTAAAGRVRWDIAAGPAIEVSTPARRERERGIAVVPSVGLRVTSWFEYVIEGHAARYVSPVGGTIAGLVPIGWRIHTGGRTQPFVSMGAGLTWTDFARLYGLDRRMNYLTQIGGGVRHVTGGGSVISVETRFFHLSNLSSAPPNLGMEGVLVLVGYGVR